MVTIIHQSIGSACEPCIALHSGIDASYWEGDEAVLAHCESAALKWDALGVVVLASVEEEPQPHYGGFCIVCGFTPYWGTVYDYTLTVFSR